MADDALAINLKVLSPSSEFEGGIHLRDLPASTTVRELRFKIQDAVASRPGPERMRLIYRGKVVANDDATLESVFGTDNIRDSKDQSLHLVLRELPQSPPTSSTPVPRTASAPSGLPPSTAPPPAGPPLQTNPFRAIPQPRPNSQPPAAPHHNLHNPHHPHIHHHHHHHVQQPLNPLAPMGAIPLPPQMQQHIAQVLAQRGALPPTPAPGVAAAAAAAAAQPANGAQSRPTSAGGAPAPAPAPAPGLPPPGFAGMPNARTVHQEGVGPNGARWTVTYNDFTANMPLRPGQPTMPRPVPLPALGNAHRPIISPAPGGVQVPLSWLLPRLRTTLQEAARELDTVRPWLTPSAVQQASTGDLTALPSWRADRLREHLRNVTHSLNMVESGLSDPAMQLNMEVIALRQAAVEVRRQANEFSRDLDARPVSPATASPAAATLDPLLATASAVTRTLPPDAPQELYLLSSPQGPVGILFDQQGTYTTAPLSSPMSSQTFIDQYNQNRQLIARLGQHIAQSSHVSHGQLGRSQPTPTQHFIQPQPAQPEALDQAAAQRVIQNIIQNRDQRQAANAPPANPDAPADNDRAGNMAGHLWLMFKLACFVYIFAGGGGWYRPLMLGSIAIIVYIIQLGVFEAQLNVIRRHFEVLLPNADRIAQRRAHDANQPNAAGADPRRNLTPEEAARRILQQQRNNQFGWVRDGVRTLERGVALFVASLWPGIGERMVHAQEERERLERVAASEERERVEEERRRAEEEAKQGGDNETGPSEASPSEEKKPLLERNATQTLSEDFMDSSVESTDVAAAAATASTAKGKERAVDTDGEGVASAGF